jgi:hypothetical protein
MPITSDTPLEEIYQHWWIDRITILSADPQGDPTCEATLRLCKIEQDGSWTFHPTHPTKTLYIGNINAVANEDMDVAIAMGTMINAVGKLAKQSGLL